jgi:PAS domain S-box-containing protein
MGGRLQRLWAGPAFADEESQRVGRLLHTILLTGMIVCATAGIVHTFVFGGAGTTAYIYPPTLVLCVVLLGILYRGHVQLTGLLLLISVWTLIVLSALTDGGVHGPSLGGLVLVVIVSTLLFSRVLVIAFLTLCVLTLTAFLLLELTGALPIPTAPPTLALAYLARSLQLLGAGVFLFLAVRNLQDARGRARDGETRAAELLREANAARKYTDNILSSMAESLVVLDERGTIQTVNDATLVLLGHRTRDLVGQPYTTVLPDFGEHPGDLRDQHDPVERSYLHSDGRPVPILLTRSRLGDETGRAIGSVCVASDITQLKDAENSLREAKQLAEEASLAKSRFLANMSHELRTPLNAVIGYAEMLLEESDERGLYQSAEELRKIQLAGKHLLGLISDILDLSKIEAGRMDIHLETFDVADMVETVLGTVRPLMARNGNEIVVTCPPTIGFVHADLTKIRQILLNLLSNAAKFTDKGVIRLSVTRAHDGPGRIVFVIADTGIGMTQGQLSRLFQAFSQGDASTARRYGGTGLGLAITKAFVDMLGGSIEVQSKLGNGTVFVVRLPYVDPMELSMSKRGAGLKLADLARAAHARALQRGGF